MAEFVDSGYDDFDDFDSGGADDLIVLGARQDVLVVGTQERAGIRQKYTREELKALPHETLTELLLQKQEEAEAAERASNACLDPSTRLPDPARLPSRPDAESASKDGSIVLPAKPPSADVNVDEEAGWKPLITQLFEVRIFYEQDEGVKHSSKSVYFYALMMSMRSGSIFHRPVFASVCTILVQLGLLHGFVFAYFIGPATQQGWNTWHRTLSIPPEHGGFYATLASFIALAAAPIVIVVKLERAHEFELTPCFRATMRAHMRLQSSKYDDPYTQCLYYFWAVMYALRAFIMVMYLAFTNAVLAVAEKNVRSIIIMVLVVAFLLDLDEYTYLTFFADKDDLGALKLGTMNCVIMGRRTKAACEEIRKNTTYLVTAYQVVLMVTLKTHPWILTLWTMPCLAMLLLMIQMRPFPRVHHKYVDVTILLGALLLVWLYLMRCIITPICGAESRFYIPAPW